MNQLSLNVSAVALRVTRIEGGAFNVALTLSLATRFKLRMPLVRSDIMTILLLLYKVGGPIL